MIRLPVSFISNIPRVLLPVQRSFSTSIQDGISFYFGGGRNSVLFTLNPNQKPLPRQIVAIIQTSDYQELESSLRQSGIRSGDSFWWAIIKAPRAIFQATRASSIQ